MIEPMYELLGDVFFIVAHNQGWNTHASHLSNRVVGIYICLGILVSQLLNWFLELLNVSHRTLMVWPHETTAKLCSIGWDNDYT